jgi:hypothetical protein
MEQMIRQLKNIPNEYPNIYTEFEIPTDKCSEPLEGFLNFLTSEIYVFPRWMG